MATTDKDPVVAARTALMEKGYSRVKAGATNIPGYNRIETWMKRSGSCYLIFNEAGEWDVLKSAFATDPTPDAIKDSTSI